MILGLATNAGKNVPVIVKIKPTKAHNSSIGAGTFEGKRKEEEGRRKKEEGRGKREEGRRKKEEGRGLTIDN